MMVVILLLVAVALLLLNAFFVLAEFAAVKVRETQIEAMEGQGQAGAHTLRHIHQHLDEYLSVCQLGITFASIGLGFVGEPAFARLLLPLLGSSAAAHTVAITISYIFISALHILLGEQVPKYVAIRRPEHSALLIARPLRVFRWLFYGPLWVLNGSANYVLRRMGLPPMSRETAPSEAEVRIILERSQQQGLMPFRRLLLMENVFDFGDVRVRDAMRPIDQLAVLRADRSWKENQEVLATTRFSRYPLLEGDPPQVLGIVHVKDILYHPTHWPRTIDLKALARKAFPTSADTPLETLLVEFRRRRLHMALVQDSQGALCGVITMEDILEQLVGSIEDEFEKEAPIRLGDALKKERILLDLKADTAPPAIREVIARCPTDDLPISRETILNTVLARERSLSTYLGDGLAVPHGRLDELTAPYLFCARSASGVRFGRHPSERAHVLFILLTPTSQPRAQVRLLARIAALRESEYVWDRLMNAASAAEAHEVIRSGDELTIS